MNKQWQISETVQLACLDGLMFGHDEAAADIELSSNVHNSDYSIITSEEHDGSDWEGCTGFYVLNAEGASCGYCESELEAAERIEKLTARKAQS